MLYNCFLCSTGIIIKTTRCKYAPPTEANNASSPNPCLSHVGYYNGRAVQPS